MSTESQDETSIFVVTKPTCAGEVEFCVAQNVKSVRGASCSRGAEVTFESSAELEYFVVVLARRAVATPQSEVERVAANSAEAQALRLRRAPVRSFALAIAACAEFVCPFARSCLPCAFAQQSADAPQKVILRDKVGNLAVENRCSAPECGGLAMRRSISAPQVAFGSSFSTRLVFCFLAFLAQVVSIDCFVAGDDGAQALRASRSNIEIQISPRHVTSALFAEPDFENERGNDNSAFAQLYGEDALSKTLVKCFLFFCVRYVN